MSAVFVLLLMGGVLYLASGASSLDDYRSIPELTGAELARATAGREVLLSGRLTGDHPVVQPARALICAQREGHNPGSSNLSTQLDEEDREASATPRLRIGVGGAEIGLPPPYTILSGAVWYEERPPNDARWYEWRGFRNGDAIGARGLLQRGPGGELELDHATLVSGDASEFVRYYERHLTPFYQIGLGALGLGALLALIGGFVLVIRVRRFFTPGGQP